MSRPKKTTDFVYEELNEDQKSPVSILFQNGFLKIIETEEIIDFQSITELLEYSIAIEKIEQLYQLNNRFPKKEIDKRIEHWNDEKNVR